MGRAAKNGNLQKLSHNSVSKWIGPLKRVITREQSTIYECLKTHRCRISRALMNDLKSTCGMNWKRACSLSMRCNREIHCVRIENWIIYRALGTFSCDIIVVLGKTGPCVYFTKYDTNTFGRMFALFCVTHAAVCLRFIIFLLMRNI